MKNIFSRLIAQCHWLVILALSGIFVFSAAAKPYGVNEVPRTGPFLNGVVPEVAPVISGNWSAVVAFTNLLFTNSVGLTHVPDSNLLCVWEREGRKVSRVASRLSISPKKVRRILARVGRRKPGPR